MQHIADFVNSAISNYHIDSHTIQSMKGCLNREMKVNGWITFILSTREYVVLKFDNGVFMNEGFVVNDEKVLKVFGNHQIGDISYREEQFTRVEEGIVDLGNGSRFEGLVLIGKEGKIGIPFGYGEMRDIEEYEGNGSKPLNIGIKHLKMTDDCVLVDWDVSWLLNLESIDIGDDCYDCFGSVQTFKIDGLNRLKTIKIGNNSFTQKKNGRGNGSKSFHILNCESLKSIEIGEHSFSDFGGEFELKNLPQLRSIQIGTIGKDSCNFSYSSFVIGGIELILNS